MKTRITIYKREDGKHYVRNIATYTGVEVNYMNNGYVMWNRCVPLATIHRGKIIEINDDDKYKNIVVESISLAKWRKIKDKA